jgi:hypothetical protein
MVSVQGAIMLGYHRRNDTRRAMNNRNRYRHILPVLRPSTPVPGNVRNRTC